MYRAVRARPQTQLASRVFRRGAHTEYGPEQKLLNKSYIIATAVTTGFIGLVWYDKFYAKGLKEGKSFVGDKLIPSGPSREEVAEREDEFAQKALKRRQEMQLLFSAENNSVNLKENIRQQPVPEVLGKSLRPGQTMDLDKIDERRPRTVYFAPKKDGTESSS